MQIMFYNPAEYTQASFNYWLGQVDKAMNHRAGWTHDDLPAVDYRSMFDNGDSPYEAAKAAIGYIEAE